MSKDYYEILGVKREADDAQIKSAFRKAAHKYHPDKDGGDAEKFKEVNEAYQVLSNKQKRAQYDQFGQSFNQAGGPGGPGGAAGYGGFQGGPFGNANFSQEDLGDLFGDLFGFGRSNRRSKAQRGEDLAVNIDLDFKEGVFGIKKDLEINRLTACDACSGSGDVSGEAKKCETCNGQGRVRQVRQTILGSMAQEQICSDCQGDGKVPEKQCAECSGQGRRKQPAKIQIDVPAGISSGQVIRLREQGHVGRRGAPAGDLLVSVTVADSDQFVREGFNITTSLELEYPQVVLGDKVEIDGLSGKLEIDIPAGTSPGRVIRLRGEGVPVLNGHGRGDLFVELNVVSPKKVSSEEKELLEAFLQARGKKIKKKKRSFFGG